MDKTAKKEGLDAFCANVAQIRRKLRATKEEMAKIMDVSVSTLTSIENGKVPPSYDVGHLIRLCCYVRVRPRDMFIFNYFSNWIPGKVQEKEDPTKP